MLIFESNYFSFYFMSKEIGLFFGSTGGATEEAAEKIAAKSVAYGFEMTPQDVAYLKDIRPLTEYKLLILGTSTWYFGEHQGDWEDIIDNIPEDVDFTGTTFAMFGLGDQEGYPDWFLDAMGMIAEELINRGATLIGRWSIDGYDFDESKAVFEAGYFCGLALDDDCQPKLTDQRIDQWLKEVMPLFAALA